MSNLLIMPLLSGRLHLERSLCELFVKDLIRTGTSSPKCCALSALTEMLQKFCCIMLPGRPLPAWPQEGPGLWLY